MKIKVDLNIEMEWEEFKKEVCPCCRTKGSFNYDKHYNPCRENGEFECRVCDFRYEYEENNGKLTSLQIIKRII